MASHQGADYDRISDPALLHKIDQLFACNVGSYISLPQLVVVGDQSSGKSSVLEGLTRLPFPRDSGLCTRFATRITFRHTAKKSTAVTIIPAPDAAPEQVEKLKKWSYALETLDAQSFSKIMAEVHDVMDLSDRQNTVHSIKDTFSKNVLQLEICGPEEDHLSVIDVPGIFKNTTSGVTTKSDIETVRRVVQGYMENPLSVMLAVVPANVDIATQEIVEMAKGFDADRARTLGVLTKPDLVEDGDEQRIVDLICGQKQGDNLQWSVVRNPGQKDLQTQSTGRQSEEDFFRDETPWNTIEKDRVGVDALRKRLQEVITDHTRKKFPQVKMEINKRLKEAKSALDSLGDKRDTAEKQRRYMLKIVTEFQDITSKALAANYGGDDLFKDQDLRLPTKVVKRNETFSDQLQKWGQQYYFSSNHEETSKDAGSELELGTENENLEDNPGRTEEGPIEVRVYSSDPDVEHILHDQKSIPSPSDNILGWLKREYENSRGMELGTFSSFLLSTIMKTQSTKWTDIAMGYISDMVLAVHKFILRLLKSVCPDDNVRTNLLSILTDDLLERYKRAIDHVRFLLGVERAGTHSTQNHYFSDNLGKFRRERLQAAMADKCPTQCTHGQVVKLPDIVEHFPMSNKDDTVLTIHDILKAYYKVARKRFVDNVCLQGADHFLITGSDGPLKLLSPSYVQDLTEEQLETIAGEDAALKRKRKQLSKQISDLEAGRKILT